MLTSNATIGGSGRFDIRNGSPLLNLAGFRLTKIGANQFSVINGSISSGNIDLNGGDFFDRDLHERHGHGRRSR